MPVVKGSHRSPGSQCLLQSQTWSSELTSISTGCKAAVDAEPGRRHHAEQIEMGVRGKGRVIVRDYHQRIQIMPSTTMATAAPKQIDEAFRRTG